MAKKTVYAVQISDTAPEQGVSLVSFVETPAIGVNFVTLGAEKPLAVALKADAKKQILTGPVLIPDVEIVRLADDKKSVYYLTFSAEVIEQLRDRFHEQNNTQATNLQHETPLEGPHVVESWIVTDATQDKAYALGFSAAEVPVGTWMASYKVPDKTLWDEQIETGKVKGFSMEGLLGYTSLSKVLMYKNPQPAGKNLFARLKAKASAVVASIFLGVETLEDDSTVDVDDETGEVFSLDADGNRGEVVADGTYKLKDGGELVVKDGKKVEAEADGASSSTTDTTGTTDTSAAATKLADEAAATTAVEASSITLEGGEVITHDPIGKKLYKADGTLLPTGKYKTDKGVMFKVTTDQWWYETQETLSAQINVHEVALSGKDAEIQELKAKLADAEVKLKAKPAAAPIKLAGDKGAEKLAEQEKPLTPGQQRFQRAVALSGLK
jgi:hypothetical protein